MGSSADFAFLSPALMGFAVAGVSFIAAICYGIKDWRTEHRRRQRLVKLTGA